MAPPRTELAGGLPDTWVLCSLHEMCGDLPQHNKPDVHVVLDRAKPIAATLLRTVVKHLGRSAMDLDTFIIAVLCWIDESLPLMQAGHRLRQRGPGPVL